MDTMMRVSGRWPRAVRAALLAGFGLAPGPARGDAGVEATPSLSVAQVYDDNIFYSASSPQADRIARITPALALGYHGARLSASGRYGFDAESFSEHPEMSDSMMRQRAGLDLAFEPARSWSASLTGTYARTRTPGDFNTQTGFLEGRASAERWSLGPAITARLGAATQVRAGSTFIREEVSGSTAIDTRIERLDLDRGVSPRDTVGLGILLRQFRFDDGTAIASRAVTLGWSRKASARTELTLRAGPRFTEGAVDAEVSASLRFRLKTGDLSAAYTRSMTTVAGEGAATDFDTLGLTIAGRPRRTWRLSLAPSVTRIMGQGNRSEARVYQALLSASRPLGRWLSFNGSVQFTAQRGTLAPAALPAEQEIRHTLLLVGVSASYR